MSKKKRMSNDDLVSIIDNHLTQSTPLNSKISGERALALKYYNCEPFGNEKTGRSTFVSSEVRDTIGWCLPLLVKILAGEEVISFDPDSEQSVDSAELAGQYAHYVLHKKNPGFEIIHNMCHDALLNKNAYVKVSVDATPVYAREFYENLSVMQLTQLLQPDDVDIVDKEEIKPEPLPEEVLQKVQPLIKALQEGTLQEQQVPPELMMAIQAVTNPPQSTYNVTIKRRKNKNGTILVENIPPEEIIVSKHARSLNLDLSPFVAHRVKKTISWLRGQGYTIEDDIDDTESSAFEYSAERVERDAADGTYNDINTNNEADPSQREVTIVEAHFMVDFDGSGIAQRRCVKKIGKRVIENVEVICQPFVSCSPYPVPHKHTGTSMADLVMQMQKLKSMLTRASLDSFAFNISPPRVVNVDALIDVNDLLDTAPGSYIRARGDANAALQTMPTSGIGTETLPFFEYIDNIVESRTGTSRMTQGINANAFTQTATGTMAVMTAAQEKSALIVSILAHTGLGEIYKKIVKLAAEYIRSPECIRLNSNFTKVNPSDWANLDTITVNVGISGLDKQQELINSQNILNLQKEVGSIPNPSISSMIGPEVIHNALSRVVKSFGFKNPEMFFNDPKGDAYKQLLQTASQVQPPPPDPNMVLAQAQVDLSKVKAMEVEANTKKTNQEMFLKQTELDLKKATAVSKDELDRLSLQLKSEIEYSKQNTAANAQMMQEILSQLQQLNQASYQAPANLPGQLGVLPNQ